MVLSLLPAGPKGWFPIGNMKPDDVNAMVQLTDKYGTIFKLTSMFGATHVVVCDPALAAAVLIDEEAFLPKPLRPQRCINEVGSAALRKKAAAACPCRMSHVVALS